MQDWGDENRCVRHLPVSQRAKASVQSNSVAWLTQKTWFRRRSSAGNKLRHRKYSRRRRSSSRLSAGSASTIFSQREFNVNNTWVSASSLAALSEQIDEGTIKPFVGRTYPLSGAAQAWKDSRAGHIEGKVVFHIPSEG
jgi:NADPH:quinone reductase-like Zn-dependent oxidoreductase